MAQALKTTFLPGILGISTLTTLREGTIRLLIFIDALLFGGSRRPIRGVVPLPEGRRSTIGAVSLVNGFDAASREGRGASRRPRRNPPAYFRFEVFPILPSLPFLRIGPSRPD